MKKLNTWLMALLGLAILLIQGCSGGGNAGGGNDSSLTHSTSPLSTITGVVSDGPIENAQVFIDLNLNGLYDSGEPYDITDAEGRYEINYVLDDGVSYILVIVGSSDFKTVDPIDNQGVLLNFVMFDEFTSSKYTSVTNIVGTTYHKDIKPSNFKSYLSKLDEKVYNSFDVNNTVIRQLIDAPASTSEVELFQTYILNKESVIGVKLQEVVEKIKEENNAKIMEEAKKDLNLQNNNILSISDKNITELKKELYYKDKTLPNKIQNFIFAKELTKFDIMSDYGVFVTKYENILEIPDYKTLQDANYTLLDGADIYVTLNGVAVQNNPAIASEIINGYKFTDTSKKVDLLQYINGKWELKAVGINVSDLATKTLELAPFVLVEKSTFTLNEYSFENIAGLKDTVVIVKGKSTTSSNEENIILNYAVPDLNGKVHIMIPDGFEVSDVVILSKSLVDITQESKASISLEVDEGKVIQNEDSITPLKYVTDNNESDFIINGNLLQSSVGIDSMIDTKFLYNNLIIGLNFIDNSEAKDVLNTNISNFMGGNNTFDSKSQTSIKYGTSSLNIDKENKTLKFESSTYDDSVFVSSTSITWTFTNNTIKRVVSISFNSGDKKGSSTSSTYLFEYKDIYKEVVANYDESIIEKTSLSQYSDTLEAKYTGTAIFTRESDDSIKKLIGAKFTQNHVEYSSIKGKSHLNGVVTTRDINSTLDPYDNTLAFEGEFLLQNDFYDAIEGKIIISKEDANTTKGIKNKNFISSAIIVTNHFDKLDVDNFYVGNWNGAFTNSCSDNNGSLYVDFDTLSWQGYDQNQTYYGASIVIDNNRSIFYNDHIVWGTAEINGTSLSGIWQESACNGKISLQKQ